MEEAILAGGCFWCMQGPFEKVKGVTSVVAGYTGGELTGEQSIFIFNLVEEELGTQLNLR